MSRAPADTVQAAPQSLPAAFLAFLETRELRVFRDRASGAFIDFAALDQVASASDGEWVRASGRARLYSYVVYRRQYHPDFPPPYNVAAVMLEEGPVLISTVLAEPQQLALDMPLTAGFDQTGRLIFKPTPQTGKS